MSTLKNMLLNIAQHVTTDRWVKNYMYFKLAMGFYNEYNFNYSSNEIVTVISRAHCICLPLMLIFLSLYTNFKYFNSISTTQYLSIVLISHFTYDGYFTKFYSKLRSIDAATGLGARHGGDIKLSIFVLLLNIIWHIVGYVGYFFVSRLQGITVSAAALTVVAIGNVLGSLIVVAMFEMLWHRVAALRKRLENDLSTVDSRQRGAEHTIVKMKECLRVYRSLLDTLRDTGAAPKLLMFINVVYSLPRVLLLASHAVQAYPDLLHMLYVSFEGVSIYIVTCVPAVLVECCASEVDRIKLLINKQLLLCTGADGELFAAIEDSQKFLTLRPFTFTVFRVFNVDASLTINLVTLWVTYVIVLVQFMHLFD